MARAASVRFGLVLLVTAVVGLGIGVALSLRQERQFEQELDAMQERAAAFPFPIPAPRRAPDLSQPPDPKLLQTIPGFPQAFPRDLFQGQLLYGSPMSVAWFETPESVNDVLTYYDEYYKLAGQEHTVHRYGDNSGYVAWFEESLDLDAGEGEGLMHMVSAVRQGNTTIVLLSETDPLGILNGMMNSPLPEGVFFPENAQRPTAFNLGDAVGGQLSIHSSVKGAQVSDVGRQYVDRFTAGGWSVSAPQQFENSWSVSAKKGSTEQTVALLQAPAAVDIVVTYKSSGE